MCRPQSRIGRRWRWRTTDGASTKQTRARLHEAAAEGNLSIVHTLLDRRADVNARGDRQADALCAASAANEPNVVRLLLDWNVDGNQQGGKRNENALIALLEGTWVTPKEELRKTQVIATPLIDHRVDVNAHGERHGSALAAAAYSKNIMMKLLLGRGANPHAQVTEYNINALVAALENHLKSRSAYSSGAVIDLLLDFKFNVNAHGGIQESAVVSTTGWPYEWG